MVLNQLSLYTNLGGILSHKAMINKFYSCLEEKITVVKVEGCASIIGTKETIGKTLKLVKLVEEEDTVIDKAVKKIRKEARTMKYKSAFYDLSDFNSSDTVNATSPTLLELISKLVSDGNTTIQSLCLSQIIQSHISQNV